MEKRFVEVLVEVTSTSILVFSTPGLLDEIIRVKGVSRVEEITTPMGPAYRVFTQESHKDFLTAREIKRHLESI